jgi:carboxyl-terminal processing protease
MIEEQKIEPVNSESKTNYVYLIPILMGITLAIGVWLGTLFIPVAGGSTQIVETSNKFQTILQMIEERYVDSVDNEFLIESSIQGMIEKLDPHSQYIPAKDLASVNEQLDGHFGGVGIRFLIHNDSVVATHVLPGSPSMKAGMIPGDRLIEVDGENIASEAITNEKVMELLKGTEGSTVKIKIFRQGQMKDISIVRGSIGVSSIDAAIMLTPQIGFIKLNSFTMPAGNEFEQAAAQLKKQGMKKLIFDLRNNGGGYMSAATEIVDQFLPSGKLIVYTEGRNQPKDSYYSTSRGILEDVELVILINSMSASASEIVAGAIQDNDRGFIMGRRSFGKGLVQDQQELIDGSALRLTISRYYTPTGRCIQKPYGEGVDYENDYYDRYERGELMNEDSLIMDESLKFTTLGGRTVYGGGGIYPDTFIPNDTAGASYYLSELYYMNVFNHWAIRYLDLNRSKLNNLESFLHVFTITTGMFEDFVNYAETLGVQKRPLDIVTSRTVIKNRMKAELARHLWEDNGYYAVYLEDDLDVQSALKYFRANQ